MQISERTIKALQEVINGDEHEFAIYRSGPVLVDLFNEFGRNDVYGAGFPSRWQYSRDCIRHFNGTDKIKDIIEVAVDPRDYLSLRNEVDSSKLLKEKVIYLNKFLEFDGYILKKQKDGSNIYKVYKFDGQAIPNKQSIARPVIVSEKIAILSHEFIAEQIEKANEKLAKEDYDGAITNARSLVEAVQKEIIRKAGKEVPKHGGDVKKLYKEARQVLNFDPSQPDLAGALRQILSGLDSVISGIGGVSNMVGDRHDRQYKPEKHHAKLAVNTAITFCEFLVSEYEHQQNQN